MSTFTNDGKASSPEAQCLKEHTRLGEKYTGRIKKCYLTFCAHLEDEVEESLGGG